MLANHSVFYKFSEQIVDPDDKTSKVFRLLVCTRGPKSSAKYKVLNSVLVAVSCSLKLLKYSHVDITKRPVTPEIANALYQPNTLQTFWKHIFSWFSRNGVVYKASKDFNGEGGFQAFYKNLYASCELLRMDLGRKPMQASVDLSAEHKIRKFGNFKPMHDYDDCMMLLMHYTLKNFQMRASKEVSFFVLYIYLIILFHFTKSSFL